MRRSTIRITLTIVILALAAMPGCLFYRSYHVAGIEPASKVLKDQPYEVVGQAETSISNFSLFWVWTVTPKGDFDRALLEMASQKGGDDVIEVTWWRERQQWLVGSVTIIHIKGTVIRYIK